MHVVPRAVLVTTLLVVSPSPGFAGDVHAREYPAQILSVSRVESFELDDPWVRIFEGDAAPVRIRISRRACAVKLRVQSDYKPLGGAPIAVYASPEACAKLARGAKVSVLYFGLAQHFRIVALRTDDEWRALPLMQLTTSSTISHCLAVRSQEHDCGRVHRDNPL